MISFILRFYLFLKALNANASLLLLGVRSCYDEGKRTAETLTMDYHRGANLEVLVLLKCLGSIAFRLIFVGCSTLCYFVFGLGEDRPDLQHIWSSHVHR